MRNLPAFIVLVGVIFIWHLVVSTGLIPIYLLPTPLQIWQAVQENFTDFSSAFLSTASSSLIGFLLSAVFGFLTALLLTSSKFLKQALLPFAIFFQTVPIVAIAPLLVIWMGFGEPTVRASAFIVSFFPVLANSLVGLGQADAGLLELFQSYEANKWQKLLKLQIPAALPSLFAGLQVASGLAVIGAIVGEFVAGGGLGGWIDTARTQQRVDLVFAAVLLSAFLGFLFLSSIRLLSRRLLKFRPFFNSDVL